MTRIAFVTDSTCDLPPEWQGRSRLHVLPVHIHFGESSLREGVDIDEVAFYERVNREGAIPRTSQPSPGEFADLYHSLAATHDAILSLHIGGKLSGTYQSAMLAKEMIGDQIAIYPFDSDCGSLGLGFMAMEAVQMVEDGSTIPQVLARLDYIRRGMNIFLSPDTLKYVQMSGRISALGSAVASLLNIKPIIQLHEGQLLAGERVRTRKRALHTMVERMAERLNGAPARVGVADARAEEDAATLAQMARATLNCTQVWRAALATSVAVHLGPGTVGLVAYPL